MRRAGDCYDPDAFGYIYAVERGLYIVFKGDEQGRVGCVKGEIFSFSDTNKNN